MGMLQALALFVAVLSVCSFVLYQKAGIAHVSAAFSAVFFNQVRHVKDQSLTLA